MVVVVEIIVIDVIVVEVVVVVIIDVIVIDVIVVEVVVVVIIDVIVIDVIVVEVIMIHAVHVHLGDLAGHGVHLILVLHAVQHERHFIVAVVQVVFPLHKLQVVPAQLRGQQVLGCLGVDVILARVGVVQIVLIQRHGAAADLFRFHGGAGGVGQVVHELLIRDGRPVFQAQDDVLFLARDGLLKISVLVDAADQLAHHAGARLAFVAGIPFQHGAAVPVQGVQGQHLSGIVIFHLDLGVHAQQHRTGRGPGGCRLGRGGTGGHGGRGRCGGRGGVSAGSQGENSGQGQRGQGKHRGLFHLGHLLVLFLYLCGKDTEPDA